MDKLERRTSSWEAGSEASITGYAVVFEQRTVLYRDPDTGLEYGEIIDRNALDGADMSDVVLRYNHTGHVLARTRNNTLKLTIDDHGLQIEADMSKSEEARNFYEEVKAGLIDKMSFCFTMAEGEWDRTTRTSRVLKIGKLLDVAIVDFPAYEQTQVSARSRFEMLAEPDRVEYRIAQVSNVHTDMRNRIAAMGFQESDLPESFLSPAEYERQRTTYESNPSPGLRPAPDPTEPIRHQILEIRNRVQQQTGSSDLSGALALRAKLEDLAAQLQNTIQERKELRKSVARGAGKTIEGAYPRNRKENNMSETRTFFNDIVESRSAGTTNTMTKVIPETVMDNFVKEKTPGAFFMAARRTAISHSGDLRLPIAKLQPIEEHAENAEIEDAGYVPDTLRISHKEYCYKTGYSDLGYKLSAQNLERIIRDTIMASILKKMDGICLGAVGALEYIKGTNAIELAAAPTYADFVQLAGYLGSDFLDSAKWYMAPGTYFTWLAGLKDDQKRPILDPSKLVSDQAFCGYGIELDSQIPANTIFFGDATRVHLNYARQPELNAWTDHDHNTQKFSIRAVAGAAAEPGCMVKMSLNG